MLKEFIGTGSSVDIATQDACNQLGVDAFDSETMELEVLETGKPKVLGIFGGKEAKVKITLKVSALAAAQEFLEKVIREMGIQNVNIFGKESDNGIEFEIEGADDDAISQIIGRRGETLDALQYLTCLAVNRIDNSYKRVTINTGDYRAKREKTLESLGKKLALKVQRTGKKSILEPMNPYERRIIHTSVQKVKGVTSWSEGESINRHVVIGIDPKFKGSYPKGKQRRSYPKKQPVKNNVPKADRAPINEGESTGLYGRIDK